MPVRLIMIALFVPALFLAIAGCGDDDEDVDGGAPTPEASEPAGDDDSEPTDEPTDDATDEPTDDATDDADDDGGDVTAIEVVAQGVAFQTTEIQAPAGSEVELTLANNDSVPHTFTIDGVVDIQAAAGESGSDTFVMPDQTLDFRCTIHPSMTGTLSPGGDGAGGADTASTGDDDDDDDGGYTY